MAETIAEVIKEIELAKTKSGKDFWRVRLKNREQYLTLSEERRDLLPTLNMYQQSGVLVELAYEPIVGYKSILGNIVAATPVPGHAKPATATPAQVKQGAITPEHLSVPIRELWMARESALKAAVTLAAAWIGQGQKWEIQDVEDLYEKFVDKITK